MTKAGEVNPEVAARMQQLRDDAAATDTQTNKEAFGALLNNISGMTPQKKAFILKSEFDKKPERQPKTNENATQLFRVKKSGEQIDINETYVRERYADILPAETKTAGEIDMQLATEATKSLTLQGKLVERVGAPIAEKLLAMAGGQLGKVVEAAKPRPGANGKITSDNPWSYPPGDKEGDALRAAYITKFGTQKSLAKARELNVDLAARPMRKAGA